MLEMDIINVKDIDAEIAKLAAKVSDPRARTWFKRVPRFWLVNMDKLQEPYEATAMARDERRGSKYYHDPSARRDTVVREPDNPRTPDRTDWAFTSSEKSGPLFPSWRGEQPENKPNICPKCKGEKGKLNPETGEWKRCRTCGGTGLSEKPYSGGNPCEQCHGSGKLKPGPEGTQIPARRSEEGGTTCPACGGTGLKKEKIERPPGREGFFVGEAWLKWFLDEAGPDQPGYDPHKQTYTTNLHVQPEVIECPECGGTGKLGQAMCPRCSGTGKTNQRIATDIAQSFSRFRPSKAKAKEIYGGPPSKKELQPWMKAPGAEEKEIYHFDPIQVRRRDLFSRLQNIVNFLNFSSKALTKPIELTPDELEGLDQEEIDYTLNVRQKQKEEANALFEQMRMMKTDDVAAFRDVVMKAEEFMYNLKAHPEMFSVKKNNGRVLQRRGNLVLRRCDDSESALACGQKPAFNGIEPKGWCLKNKYNVDSYTQEGPIFYVERDGMAYVGIHPASNQVKDTQNTQVEQALSSQDAEQIAPLLVPYPADIPTESLKREARHLFDIVGAMRQELGRR